MALGKRVRDLRELRGLSQGALAKAIDVVPSYISRIEGGTTKLPSMDVIKGLARELNTTTADLLSAAAGDPAGYDNGDDTEEIVGQILHRDPDIRPGTLEIVIDIIREEKRKARERREQNRG